MRVIVHAGLNKTGSTSLQTYFTHARAGLADAGVVYPDFGSHSHWRLIVELMEGRKAQTGYLAKRTVEPGADSALATLADVIRQCRETGCDLLISHENFGVRQRLVALERFIASIEPTADLLVFAYGREPVPHYQSSVQHRLREVGSYPDLAGWTSGHVSRAHQLHSLLGERLHLRCFARTVLRDGDVVEDFRAWFAATIGRALPPAERSFRQNVAFSVEACGLILETAGEPQSDVEAEALRSLIAAYDLSRSDTNRLMLPARFADPIRADNANGWNALVDLTAHTAAEKANLRLDAGTSSPARPGMFDRWLRSHVTEEYRTAFRSYASERMQLL